MKRRDFVKIAGASIVCPSLLGCKSNEKTIDTGYGQKEPQRELYDPTKYGLPGPADVNGFLSHSLASMMFLSLWDEHYANLYNINQCTVKPYAWNDPYHKNLKSSVMWKMKVYATGKRYPFEEAVYFSKEHMAPEWADNISVNSASLLKDILAGQIKHVPNPNGRVALDLGCVNVSWLPLWKKPVGLSVIDWRPDHMNTDTEVFGYCRGTKYV